MVPVQGLEGRPFQEWVVKQPVKHHGIGFRSLEDTCFPAFIGALEQAAPYMARVDLLEVIGRNKKLWKGGRCCLVLV